jgi:hypothetical protein
MAQMTAAFQKQGRSLLAVQEVPLEHTKRYGIVKGEPAGGPLMRIDEIVEKPAPEVAPSRMGVAGRYVLTPRIFDEIRNQPKGVGGEIQLTDAIERLMQHEAVYAYQYAASAMTAAARKAFCKPRWSWRCSTRSGRSVPRIPQDWTSERTPCLHNEKACNCRPFVIRSPPLTLSGGAAWMNSSPTVCCSTSSLPVCLAKAWKSRSEPVSVATTLSNWPLSMRQGLLGLENGQRAVQAAGVDFLVNLHGFLAKCGLGGCLEGPL